MSAAEREAERRWPGIGRGAERAALDRAMRGGFEAGAEWQAERDAERIAELEAEVERLRAWKSEALTVLSEWEATWDAADRPGKPGSSKARGVREWIAQLEAEVEEWRRVAADQTRMERDRAEVAEAKLAAVRAVCVARTEEYPDDPYDFVREFALVMLAVLDGGDET